ncbi:DNA polymerase beta domain protein region [Crinalium epipsammum PCC 9333]|uniref:DNA polymerase beta domain protein region n=1 Tax=Crinalium epipsammum PCC 9333 TaxID=1173022 RepID=K9VY60_9CYAN|nr:nucleotidyltransferase [Crinalium epipsammum]AFZ12457.1 DNA polymerase beta domain protein region [Crinalium epipsammum PCC 9333]
MKTLPIDLPKTEIHLFCQRHHIQRLSLFGSVLRDDFSPQSDIDVLVEFELGKTPGLAIVRMQDELSYLFGRVVDLRTPADLSRYFRDFVLQEAMVIYDQN